MTQRVHPELAPRDRFADARVAELKRRIRAAHNAREAVELAAPMLAEALSRVCRQGQPQSDYLTVLELTRVVVQKKWGFAAYRETPVAKASAVARQRSSREGGARVPRKRQVAA